MTDRELMQQALEALEALTHSIDTEELLHDDQRSAYKQCIATITALRERLAQPEQEPRAWINWSALTGEPRLGWECESELASEALYTAPSQRKPLTEQEILNLLPDAQHGWTTAFYGKWVARAVERAHGIKKKT